MEKLNKLSSIVARPASLVGLLMASSVFLVGCDPVLGIAQFMCIFDPDPVHCRQEASVEANSTQDCTKIGQKAEYAKFGSNPPQDKCIMMVAANKEDPSACDSIKGGVGSYTKEECQDGVAKTATKPETCGKLAGQAATNCVNNMTTAVQAELLTESSKPNPDKTKLDQLQKNMQALQKMNGMTSNLIKSTNDMQRGVIQNLR